MKKIAIFGGAFNPPTLGHYHIIEQIFKNSDTKKIYIVPDGFRLDKEYLINDTHRKNLINLFIDDLLLKGYNIELDSYFLEGKNYSDTTTYEVDKYFIEKLGYQAYHIFGTDISSQIKFWTGNPDKYIQKKLKKIFIPRNGFTFDSNDLENYKLIDTNSLVDISSTMVKKFIKENKNFNHLLSNNVAEYIIKNKLYKNI